MTGRLRFGKMSMGIRRTASPLPRATATTATMTVMGRRMAKLIGFMARSVRWGEGRARGRASTRWRGRRGGLSRPMIDVRYYADHNGLRNPVPPVRPFGPRYGGWMEMGTSFLASIFLFASVGF